MHDIKRARPGEVSATACTFPEEYDVANLLKFSTGVPQRARNVGTLASAWKTPNKARRGRVSKDEKAHQELNNIMAEKLTRAEHILETMSAWSVPAGSIAYNGSGGSSGARDMEIPLARNVSYVYKRRWPSRRYAAEFFAAQMMDRRLQKVLLSDTYDFDIENCLFCLLQQIIERVQMKDTTLFSKELDVLDRCCNHRDDVCRNELHLPLAIGKKVVLEVVSGSAIPSHLTSNDFLQKLSSASRMLRWLAISLMPDVFDQLLSDDTRWAEASTFSFMWQGVEDYVISSIVDLAREEQLRHLSIHFDGVRIDTARVLRSTPPGEDPSDAFCRQCQERIHKDTGYKVRLVEKTQNYMLDILRSRAVSNFVSDVQAGDITLMRGNCIPAGIAWLTGSWEAVKQRLAEGSENNLRARDSGSRSYRDCGHDFAAKLEPKLDLCGDDVGKFLMHTESSGIPHAIGFYSVCSQHASSVTYKEVRLQ